MSDHTSNASPDGVHTCPGCMTSDTGGGGIPPELALALQFLHARQPAQDGRPPVPGGPPEDAGLRNAIEALLITYGAVLKARAAAVEAVAATFRT